MPTPNDAPKFIDSAPETAAAAGEHHYRLSISAWSAREALLKQYGSEVTAAYAAHVQSFEAEAGLVQREFEGNNEPEGLVPAA